MCQANIGIGHVIHFTFYNYSCRGPRRSPEDLGEPGRGKPHPPPREMLVTHVLSSFTSMPCVPPRPFCSSFELELLELEPLGGKAGGRQCHLLCPTVTSWDVTLFPQQSQCDPWQRPCEKIREIRDVGALSDSNKHTRLSWADRIIVENGRHLIAVLQTLMNSYKQYSVAINHFTLIQQTPPHLNKSLETQHCTKFWSDRVDISWGFVADGHILGFCVTPNTSPALQPFAGFTLGCISCMAGSEQQQTHTI